MKANKAGGGDDYRRVSTAEVTFPNKPKGANNIKAMISEAGPKRNSKLAVKVDLKTAKK